MSIRIRGIEPSDAPALHEILTSDHVIATTMRVPLAPVSETAKRIEPRAGLTQIVAELDDRLAGFGELITYPDQPRMRHSGEINLVAVHPDLTRRGVGRVLTEALIALADDFLDLKRLSMVAFTANQHAIAMYEGLGFVHEGTMPRFGYGNGEWMDACLMARLRD